MSDDSEFNLKIAELTSEGTADELFESAFGMVSVAIFRALESGDKDLVHDALDHVSLMRSLLGEDQWTLMAKLNKLENEGNADVSVPNPEG